MAALDISYDQYVEINGGERCGICKSPRKPEKRLDRDHDHRTGQPRGLLCFRCNAALRDYMTIEWMTTAIKYMYRAKDAR